MEGSFLFWLYIHYWTKMRCSEKREIEQKWIYICVRRRRTHTNRVVFTKITLEGFMDQSQGDRSGYHTILGIGRHFGMAGWVAGWLCSTNSLDLVCKCFLRRLELKTPIFFFCTISTITKTFTRDRTCFINLWLLLVLIRILQMSGCVYRLLRRHTSTGFGRKNMWAALSFKWKLE